jgi:hypothetical protein
VATAAFFCEELFGVALSSFFLRILPLLPLLSAICYWLFVNALRPVLTSSFLIQPLAICRF